MQRVNDAGARIYGGVLRTRFFVQTFLTLFYLSAPTPAFAGNRTNVNIECLESYRRITPADFSAHIPTVPLTRVLSAFFRNFRDPLRIFDSLLNGHPLVRVSGTGMRDIFVIGNYELARQLLAITGKLPVQRDSDMTASGARQYGKENAFIADPEIHARARSYFQKAFTPRAINKPEIIEGLRKSAQFFTHSLANTQTNPIRSIDVIPQVKKAALHAMLHTAFGFHVSDSEIENKIWTPFERANHWVLIDTFLGRMGINARKFPKLLPWQRTLEKSFQAIDELVDAIIANGRAGNAKGSLFADVFSDPKIPIDYLRSTIKTTIAGAIETSSAYVYWPIHELSKNPQMVTDLRDEIARVIGTGEVKPEHLDRLPKLESFIKEAGRLYSPFFLSPRSAEADLLVQSPESGVFVIPDGSHLFLSLFHANRDKTVFEDPKTFKPDRFIERDDNDRCAAPLTFGHGIHKCIGVHLADREAKIFLIEMLRQWNFSHARPRQRVQIESTLVTRPAGGIPIFLSPRNGGQP